MAGGLNPIAYANQQPTQNIDPLGLVAPIGDEDCEEGSCHMTGNGGGYDILGGGGGASEPTPKAGAQCPDDSIVAKNGTIINGYTDHGVDRAVGNGGDRVGTSPDAILDALKNPRTIVSGVDSKGRPYQNFTGGSARVIVNPQTGQIVSVNPLSGAGTR